MIEEIMIYDYDYDYAVNKTIGAAGIDQSSRAV